VLIVLLFPFAVSFSSHSNRRLSIDAEPGLLPSTSRNTLYTVGRTSRRAVHAYNTSHGIVSIADAEGVMGASITWVFFLRV
jgi:hypothetical protein